MMFKVFKNFYRFFFKKRGWALFFFFLVLMASFCQAIQPYFYKLFIDQIAVFDFQVLLRTLILYIGVRFAAMLLWEGSRMVGDLVMMDTVSGATTSVFKHLQDLDFAYHTNKSSGKTINRIKRGEGVFWDLHNVLNFRVVEFLVSFLVMFYFFKSLDLVIVLLALASMVASFLAAWVVVPHNVKTRRAFNKIADRLTAVLVDNLINFDTVKMFAKENWERKRLEKKYRTWKKELWKYVLSFRYISLSVSTIANLSFFVILFSVLAPQNRFQVTPGTFILVAGFLQKLNDLTFNLVWNIRDLAKHIEDVKKYFEILEEKIKVKDPKNPVHLETVAGEIEFKNVNFSYEGKRQDAIRNIDLKIRQGQSVALVGRSGAGKTTVVRLLMRFYDVDRGEISLDGVNVKDFKKSELRSFMGLVPQEPVLFDNTIGYNIGYGKEEVSQREIEAASKLAQIHSFIQTLPKKYKTQVGERGIKLSGGQKQRVAIARMILSDPEIIIFDEATSQLDSESEKLIQKAFWKAAEGKTTIIIAHRLSTVMRADKIVVMDNGRIKEIGSHQELTGRKDSLYNHFWKLQIQR